MKRIVLLGVLVAGCGGDDPAVDAAATIDSPPGTIDSPPGTIDSPPGAFTLTSTAFVEGGVIPDANACSGANVSPALAWTAGPAGTMSYAIVFTDMTTNFVHSVIYDTPSNATGLPADVDKLYAPLDVPGAHQTRAYDNMTFGYLGPCPGSMHTYRFDLFALDVATLPTATMATNRNAAVGLIGMHDLATAALTGTYTP